MKPLEVECPACHVKEGQPCTKATSTTCVPVTWFHLSRKDLAEQLSEQPTEIPPRQRLIIPIPEIQKGDWASHIYRELDPRQVVRVRRAKTPSVTLDINGHETPWVPAMNYRFYRYVD